MASVPLTLLRASRESLPRWMLHALRLWPFWWLWPMHSIRPVLPLTLREQLDELGTLLEQQNMRALDVFATLQREAGSALADSVHGIEAALFQLDFTAARDQVTHLQQRLMP